MKAIGTRTGSQITIGYPHPAQYIISLELLGTKIILLHADPWVSSL